MSPRTVLSFALLLAAAAPTVGRAQTAPVVGGPRPARLTVLADSVSAGERVRVAVAVDHGPGRSAVFPAVPAGDAEAGPLLAFGDAEAFSVRRLPPRVRGDVRTDSAVYEVAVFAVDTARVGPVGVRLAAGRDTVDVPTGVAVVPVRSALRGGDAEPAPLGPPDPFPGLLPVWTALAVLAALAAAAGAWALARWRRRGQPATPRAEPFPEAAAALDALGAAEPAERALGARQALRVYLGRRLGLPALESTTDEIVEALARNARVPDEARADARRALALADLVAYAGHAPTPAAADGAIDTARTAIAGIEEATAAPTPDAEPGAASDGVPADAGVSPTPLP
ncbi:MAG TPA: hypothetical protein VF594_04930 [Rubricoccaceae bacterium]